MTEKKITTPNIFNFATSELSQSAMIAYILAWADPNTYSAYTAEHKLGKALLDALLSQAIKNDDNDNDKAIRKVIKKLEIKELRIETQVNRIDISVIINESIFLIIEDKVNTKEHSDQMARYTKAVETMKNKEDEPFKHILIVYVKTGNESKNFRPKKADGNLYACFYRKDFLLVLNKNPCPDNNIIEQFSNHLQKWEEGTQSFKTTPSDEWTRLEYEGYYCALENEFSEDDLSGLEMNWHKLSNRSGGAHILWWWPNKKYFPKNRKYKFYKDCNCIFYLQIDQDKGLFIRLDEKKDNNGNLIKINTDLLWKVLEETQKHAKKNWWRHTGQKTFLL